MQAHEAPIRWVAAAHVGDSLLLLPTTTLNAPHAFHSTGSELHQALILVYVHVVSLPPACVGKIWLLAARTCAAWQSRYRDQEHAYYAR